MASVFVILTENCEVKINEKIICKPGFGAHCRIWAFNIDRKNFIFYVQMKNCEGEDLNMYKENSKGWLKHFDFILLDLICLQSAFILAFIFRHGFVNPYSIPLYRDMAMILVFIDIVVMFFYETFRDVLKRGYYREFSVTVKHALFVELLAVFYLFTVQEGEEYSRTALYLMGMLYAIIAYIFRVIWKTVLKNKMADGGKRSLLIVTTSKVASRVVLNILENNYEMFNVAGVVIADQDKTGQKINGIPVVANAENAVDYVCRKWIDEVFIIFAPDVFLSQTFVDQFIKTGVTVHLNLARVSKMTGKKQLVEKVGNYTVLTTSMNYMTQKQAFLKRTVDIAGGLVGCFLTGIIFIFVAPIIYIQSPGPIFFSQMRIGKNGRKFKMYKFRSMYLDAEERKKELMEKNRVKDGMMFKVEFDTRVIGNKILPDGRHKTGIGNFLRVTSLDEFPQFFNVLKGDMSIVGTRPPTEDEFERYKWHHRARLAVKPGITGMWQVNGRSAITDFEEVVKLDTKYISEWSMGLDFRILLKTIRVVLKGEGSM